MILTQIQLCQDVIGFAEVKFYFRATIEGIREPLALCSLYSISDEETREYSHGALGVHSCGGEGDLFVIRAKTILSIVGMMPLPGTCDFYLLEKFSLGVIDTGSTVD